MRTVLWVLTAARLFGQMLLPDAEFELTSQGKVHHASRGARCYFLATSKGLTFVRIDGGVASLATADLNGNALHSKSDFASVHARIDAALLSRDGSFWLVSEGPYRLSDDAVEGRILFNELDLYSEAGEHLDSLRLAGPVGGSGSAMAANRDELVWRSAVSPHFNSSQTQLVHFGTAVKGKFKERTTARLEPPIFGAIPILTENGELLLIDKASGNMEVVDPNVKRGSVVNLADPRRVRAAAADGGFLYLLTADAVLKTDFSGQVMATYGFESGHGFEPSCVGVTGESLYLVDKLGQVKRFAMH
jgi:hypothetical protein